MPSLPDGPAAASPPAPLADVPWAAVDPASIERVHVVRLHLPLLEPFAAAHGVEEVRDLVLVCVEGTGGEVGWGECSTLSRPTYTSEYTAAAFALLRDELVPAVLRGQAVDRAQHPMAFNALDIALADLSLRREPAWFGDAIGSSPAAVPSCGVVGGAATVDEIVQTVGQRVGVGHRSVKLKIAPGWDVVPLAAVHEAFPDLTLAADANGSYAHADEVPAALAELGLAYVEQPLPAHDLAGSASLLDRLAVDVALDETITSAESVRDAAAAGAVTVVNVKPARLGGIAETLDAFRAVAELRLDAFVGGMLESGVGRAAALAFAAHPACTLPTDLGPSSRYFAEDVTSSIELDELGGISPPVGRGIGVEVDAAAVDRYTVDDAVITP